MTSPAKKTVNHLRHLDMFTCLEVDEAPDKPGLYAWYGLLKVGPQDWEVSLVDGEDAGQRACRTLLQRHTARYTRLPLNLEAQGTFGSSWKGKLHDLTAEKLRGILAGDQPKDIGDNNENKAYQTAIENVLSSSMLRKVMLEVLQVATPILTAPVYIGVASSLRTRLRQHTEQLFRFSEAVARSPDARETLINASKSTFASRALSMGFTPDTLTVWTLNLAPMYPDKEDQEALRTVAEACEWLLNRWHRPILGKR